MDAWEAFVRALAAEPPTMPSDDYHECKFCGYSWPEDIYAEYLNNRANGDRGRHDDDCTWVLANALVARQDNPRVVERI